MKQNAKTAVKRFSCFISVSFSVSFQLRGHYYATTAAWHQYINNCTNFCPGVLAVMF